MAFTSQRRWIWLALSLLGLALSTALLAVALHHHGQMLETTAALAWTEDVAATVDELLRCPSGDLATCTSTIRTQLAELERDPRVHHRDLVIQLDAIVAGSEHGSDAADPRAVALAAAPLLSVVTTELLGEQSRRGVAIRSLLVAAILAAGLAAVGFVGRTRTAGSPTTEELTALLASAVRSTEEGILITDTGSDTGSPSIVFANESFKRLTLRSDDDLIGQPLSVLRETALQDREFSLLEHGHADSRSATIETVGSRDDGSSVHCAWHISPVRSPSGEVTHFISVLRDITRLREHEAEQRESHRKLIEAHRKLTENQAQLIQSEKMASLGQLAAGVAHEINNPIGYVMSNVEMLADDIRDISAAWTEAHRISEVADLDNDARFVQLYDELHRSGLDERVQEVEILIHESYAGLLRVRDIVQNLSRFARADDAEIQVADINGELETALKVVWNELKHRCQVIKNLGELPPVPCRPAQLNQVFANLLINASQAIHDHGEIRITTQANQHEVSIQIQDTGEGIAPEHSSRLFDPFFTTKPAGRGTGLGLAVSYGIVQQHGGSIDVDSTPGSGSTFTVRLPLHHDSSPSAT